MATACVSSPKQIFPFKKSRSVKCRTKLKAVPKSPLQDSDFAFDSGGEIKAGQSCNNAARQSYPCLHFSNNYHPIVKVSGISLVPTNEKNDGLLPVMRICIHKPRHWKYELTTCSCTGLLPSVEDVNSHNYHNSPTKLHPKRCSGSKSIPSQNTLRTYSKPVDVILCENKSCKGPVVAKPRDQEGKGINLLVLCGRSQNYVIPVRDNISACKQRKYRAQNIRKSWPVNPEKEHFCGNYENILLKCSSARHFECAGVASASVPQVPGIYYGMRGTEYLELPSTQQCTWERICSKTGAKFEVNLVKGSRGLGLSVTGGVDSGEQWPGLIRIKRLFPHQPAWQSGCLSQGDIILAANGVSLVGCSNYEALEVLRKTPSRVTLSVCRPPSDAFSIQPQTDPPPPPRRDPGKSRRQLLPLPPLQTEGPCGEFDVTLTKVNHSLGFTLRKEDESVLGHYVRALVRDPALSNGRIRPGDKIIAVNDVDISSMSHEEAVMFLRQCGNKVKLRLYRDAAQTPVSALSPTEESKTLKPKPLLRKEAMDMLSNLAVKKLSPVDSNASTGSRFRRVLEGQGNSSLSPQRSQKTKNLTPDISGDTEENPAKKYLVSSQLNSSSVRENRSLREDHSSSNFLQSEANMVVSSAVENSKNSADAIQGANESGAKPQRPNFLDVQAGGGTMLGACRKHKFTFSSLAVGSEDTDSFDPTSDTTSITLGSISQYYTTSNSSEDFRTGSINNSDGCLPLEPMSMPPLKNLSSTSSTSTEFSYKNPAYQSANPACCLPNSQNIMKQGSEELTGHASDQDIPRKIFSSQTEPGGTRGLLKWKGVLFTPEKDEVEEIGSRITTTAKDTKVRGDSKTNEQGEQVFMVELTRGWNSRLGFSLRGDGQHTYISAIYEDSVAAKDGRLQAGDQVLMVNDESVQDMSTAEVIDLLRKIRGTIGITVLRRNGEAPKNMDS